MTIFTQLKQQFSQQLKLLKANQGVLRLQIDVPIEIEDRTLLAWLKAQLTFPHLFWKSREQPLSLLSIGELRQFNQLEEAQHFTQQTQYTLLGGITFEGECRFILPRLSLAKNSQNLTAFLYIDSDKLAEEHAICQHLLAEFDKFAELDFHDNAFNVAETVSPFPRWAENIERAINLIQQQKLRKVVLANATTLFAEYPISTYELLALSQQKNNGCYHFLWADDPQRAFMGSSPERLYLRLGDQLLTEALAGTVAVTNSAEETAQNAAWLLNDPKNRQENQLVVDDIQAHLADCVTSFSVGEIGIKPLHNVQHLRRPISATLKAGRVDSDCLLRIHPTAAVAGLPRAAAKQFIAAHEGFKRGWYAGTLGYFNPQAAEFCVALRSAKLVQNQITLYAGAGIVAASNPHTEWQEIERKSLAMAGLFI